MSIPEDHRKFLEMDFFLPRYLERKLDFDDICNIEMYGHWLAALERGEIKPLNSEQEHFLNVTKGSAEPITQIQKSWLKYKKIRLEPVICNQCAGKGYYSDPLTGDRLTCSKCHGAGRSGLINAQVTVTGSY